MRNKLQETILYILKHASEKGLETLSLFQLVKFIYLIQIESQRFMGEPFIDRLLFFREKNGPLSAQIYQAIENLKDEFIDVEKVENITYGHFRFSHKLKDSNIKIDLELEETILLNSILDDYILLSQARLKEIVYETEPMLDILQKEEAFGEQKIGTPIDMNQVPLDSEVLNAISRNEL